MLLKEIEVLNQPPTLIKDKMENNNYKLCIVYYPVFVFQNTFIYKIKVHLINLISPTCFVNSRSWYSGMNYLQDFGLKQKFFKVLTNRYMNKITN